MNGFWYEIEKVPPLQPPTLGCVAAAYVGTASANALPHLLQHNVVWAVAFFIFLVYDTVFAIF